MATREHDFMWRSVALLGGRQSTAEGALMGLPRGVSIFLGMLLSDTSTEDSSSTPGQKQLSWWAP